MTPITEAELQGRIEARALEIAEAEAAHVPPPPPIERKRYRRRLAAALPSAGRNVQLVIDALQSDGPTLGRAQLRELVHLSPSGLSNAVKRAALLGLVDFDRHSVTLHEDWAAHLENITDFMPTAGRGRRLEIADLDSTLRYARRRMAATDCPAEERARLEARCTWATRRKAEIARQEGAHRPPPAWPAPARPMFSDEPGLNRAGTAAEWAALLEDARDRKDKARQEARAWRRPEKRKERADLDAARERAGNDWPLFWAWFQARHGGEFVAMTTDEVLRHYLRWERELGPLDAAPMPTIRFVDVTAGATAAAAD
jgi:hypothetical protein